MKQKHVCIDPGHGPGCANRSPDGSYEEQEFAMDVSKRIAALLKRHGVTVTFTRTAQEYPTLKKRCQIANDIPELSLFVSIHSNAAGNTGWSKASGHIIFTSAAGETEKRNQVAKAIRLRWEEAKIPRRGHGIVHQGFTVLTDTNAPAVLLEHGFHTNREELAMLKNPQFRNLIASADAKGILDFLGIDWNGTCSNREIVKQRFGLAEVTLDYLQAYPYGEELLRKLAEGGTC